MTSPSGIITLLTDFGLQDPFVGVMHGVVLTRFAAARVVDLTHAIAPQDVAEGSFWLARSFGYFPAGTVHVAVVDPGVGTARAAVAVRAGEHYFIGPDNGLLLAAARSAARGGGEIEVCRLDARSLGLPAPSRTFHGRDLFSPVAAMLASGATSFAQLGPRSQPLMAGTWPSARRHDDGVEGRVATIDRFGNLLTNIDSALVRSLGEDLVVKIADRTLRLVSTYGEAERGEVVALLSSFDLLEIAVRDGSAAALLGAGKGEPVTVRSAH